MNNQLLSEEIKISPNPFNNSTHISLPVSYNKSLPFTFKLYNTMGEETLQLKSISSLSFTISKNNLPAGIYFYRLFDRTTTEIGSGKLVIK